MSDAAMRLLIRAYIRGWHEASQTFPPAGYVQEFMRQSHDVFVDASRLNELTEEYRRGLQ
jgi:hypothetical protein